MDKRKGWKDYLDSKLPDGASFTTWEAYCILRDAKLLDRNHSTGTVCNFLGTNFKGKKTPQGIMLWRKKVPAANPQGTTSAEHYHRWMEENDK